MSLSSVAERFIAEPLSALKGAFKNQPKDKVDTFCSAVEDLANSLAEKSDIDGLSTISNKLLTLYRQPTKESFDAMVNALQSIDDRVSNPNLNYRNPDDVEAAQKNHDEIASAFCAARDQLLRDGEALFNS